MLINVSELLKAHLSRIEELTDQNFKLEIALQDLRNKIQDDAWKLEEWARLVKEANEVEKKARRNQEKAKELKDLDDLQAKTKFKLKQGLKRAQEAILETTVALEMDGMIIESNLAAKTKLCEEQETEITRLDSELKSTTKQLENQDKRVASLQEEVNQLKSRLIGSKNPPAVNSIPQPSAEQIRLEVLLTKWSESLSYKTYCHRSWQTHKVKTAWEHKCGENKSGLDDAVKGH
jgi:chromosome segregation ATPase